jgi:hypothetical protein
VPVPNLLATISTLVGIDPEETVYSPAGRPIAITEHGVAVKQLLA